MGTASPPDLGPVAEVVLELARSRSPRAGEVRVICVDGPAGSGKTTLAAALAERTGARVVHMDDLMEGWRGLAGTGPQLESILRPLAEGRPGSYRRFSWARDAFAEMMPIPPAPWLVVEGVGSGDPVVADLVTVLVWVSVDDALRFSRGMERDGWGMESHWRQFMADEVGLFAAHDTATRADVVVDGTGARPAVVR